MKETAVGLKLIEKWKEADLIEDAIKVGANTWMISQEACWVLEGKTQNSLFKFDFEPQASTSRHQLYYWQNRIYCLTFGKGSQRVHLHCFDPQKLTHLFSALIWDKSGEMLALEYVDNRLVIIFESEDQSRALMWGLESGALIDEKDVPYALFGSRQPGQPGAVSIAGGKIWVGAGLKGFWSLSFHANGFGELRQFEKFKQVYPKAITVNHGELCFLSRGPKSEIIVWDQETHRPKHRQPIAHRPLRNYFWAFQTTEGPRWITDGEESGLCISYPGREETAEIRFEGEKTGVHTLQVLGRYVVAYSIGASQPVIFFDLMKNEEICFPLPSTRHVSLVKVEGNQMWISDDQATYLFELEA